MTKYIRLSGIINHIIMFKYLDEIGKNTHTLSPLSLSSLSLTISNSKGVFMGIVYI